MPATAGVQQPPAPQQQQQPSAYSATSSVRSVPSRPAEASETAPHSLQTLAPPIVQQRTNGLARTDALTHAPPPEPSLAPQNATSAASAGPVHKAYNPLRGAVLNSESPPQQPSPATASIAAAQGYIFASADQSALMAAAPAQRGYNPLKGSMPAPDPPPQQPLPAESSGAAAEGPVVTAAEPAFLAAKPTHKAYNPLAGAVRASQLQPQQLMPVSASDTTAAVPVHEAPVKSTASAPKPSHGAYELTAACRGYYPAAGVGHVAPSPPPAAASHGYRPQEAQRGAVLQPSAVEGQSPRPAKQYWPLQPQRPVQQPQKHHVHQRQQQSAPETEVSVAAAWLSTGQSPRWQCQMCTYVHEGAEADFMSCAMCTACKPAENTEVTAYSS